MALNRTGLSQQREMGRLNEATRPNPSDLAEPSGLPPLRPEPPKELGKVSYDEYLSKLSQRELTLSDLAWSDETFEEVRAIRQHQKSPFYIWAGDGLRYQAESFKHYKLEPFISLKELMIAQVRLGARAAELGLDMELKTNPGVMWGFDHPAAWEEVSNDLPDTNEAAQAYARLAKALNKPSAQLFFHGTRMDERLKNPPRPASSPRLLEAGVALQLHSVSRDEYVK